MFSWCSIAFLLQLHLFVLVIPTCGSLHEVSVMSLDGRPFKIQTNAIAAQAARTCAQCKGLVQLIVVTCKASHEDYEGLL